MDQKPSVGRVVIFRQPAAETPVNGTREHPAVITRVWSDNVVNLQVLFDAAPAEPRTSAQLRSSMSEENAALNNTWSWPARV